MQKELHYALMSVSVDTITALVRNTIKIDSFVKSRKMPGWCHSGVGRNPVLSICSGCRITSGMTRPGTFFRAIKISIQQKVLGCQGYATFQSSLSSISRNFFRPKFKDFPGSAMSRGRTMSDQIFHLHQKRGLPHN